WPAGDDEERAGASAWRRADHRVARRRRLRRSGQATGGADPAGSRRRVHHSLAERRRVMKAPSELSRRQVLPATAVGAVAAPVAFAGTAGPRPPAPPAAPARPPP